VVHLLPGLVYLDVVMKSSMST